MSHPAPFLSNSLIDLNFQKALWTPIHKARSVLLRPLVPPEVPKHACAASAKDASENYKKWTFLSLIPIPVLQQAAEANLLLVKAWLSYGAEEKQPGALFAFLAYTWPMFVRKDFEFDESFRIPFVATFITSFLHLQCVLFEEGLHPLIGLLGGLSETSEDDQLEQEISAIEEKQHKKNKQEEIVFDKRLVLRGMKVTELKQLAREQKLKGRSKMRKADLVAHLEASDGIIQRLKEL